MPALPPVITDATVTSKPFSWFASTGMYYGYCQIADVQTMFFDQANMTSTVQNAIVVARAITETAQELQNQLELVYQMPYTGTSVAILATLNEINRLLAASNISELVFGANAPDSSTFGAELRAKAEARILGIIDGEEQWASPFGDAVPQADKTLYPHSSLAQVVPNPGSDDPYAQQPMFSMGAINFLKPIF